MLGGEEAKDGGKGSTTSMQSRYFMDNKYCKGKRVSCIKFHPQKSYLVAMSMVDNMDFDMADISTKERYHLLINAQFRQLAQNNVELALQIT